MIDPADLRDVFDRAASLPPQERAAFLAHACDGNDGLRREVERLLAADARLGSAFDTAPRSDPATGSIAAAAMSLQPGTRLGPYEIVAALGAGGMGEVYKARDTRLDRTVAIKVLSHELTADPSARQRFDREARAIAALSHPDICALHDVGHQDGIDFLVMEFLDGETLASRLRRGKLSLQDALICATHVADALAAAHRAGIVHRDLKPGNIMLTASGVKLLDFGLAKRRQPPVATDVTALPAEPLTHTGMILGTVQYMAPEQLEGRVADERTDIFAFGVVLYELLTGRPAFAGASSAAVIGNILHAEPPAPSSIERLTPRSLDHVVRRCLAKDPAARWPSMAAVKHELETVRTSVVSIRRRAIGRWAAALSAAVLLAGVIGFGWWRLTSAVARPRTLQSDSVSTVHRKLTQLTLDDGLQTDAAFSPDGRLIAYASDKNGNFDIWVQQLSGGDPVQVTKSPANDSEPAWSPDGSTIAFRSERDGGGVYVVPALGGTERRVADIGQHPWWSLDGREILFVGGEYDSGSRLYAVSPSSGAQREVLPTFVRIGGWRFISAHPDGRISFLGSHKDRGFGFFTVSMSGQVTTSNIDRVRQTALPDITPGFGIEGQRFCWDRKGKAIFVENAQNGRNLWRVQVDPSTLDWLSAERLTTSGDQHVAAAVSPDGTHVAFSSQRVSDRLWRFALDTTRHQLSGGTPLTDESITANGVNVRRDGRVAVLGTRRGNLVGTFLLDLATGRAEIFAESTQGAVWSRDQNRVVYTKLWTGPPPTDVVDTALAVRELNGNEHLISPRVRAKSGYVMSSDWQLDGKEIIGSLIGPGGVQVVSWAVDDAPSSTPARVVLALPGKALWQARLSPDGHWLAFSMIGSEPGRSAIGITSMEGLPERAWMPVAADRRWVDKPQWGADGRTLYFLTSNSTRYLQLWGVAVDPAAGRPVAEPYLVAKFDSPRFAISPDLGRKEMQVLNDQVYLTMRSSEGNIWMLDNMDR